MRRASALVFVLAGFGLGGIAHFLAQPTHSVRAASSDRYQDYVMCTGAVTIGPRLQCDGVWMLDYRSGKLLGTCIDKNQGGKILGWAEVYLPTEFGVTPNQDVHFVMSTGYVSQGASALYIAETTTGKFGVYTMGAGDNGTGIVIRRHDMTSFRTVQQQPVQPVVGMTPVNPVPVPAHPVMPQAPQVPQVPTPQPLQPGQFPPLVPGPNR